MRVHLIHTFGTPHARTSGALRLHSHCAASDMHMQLSIKPLHRNDLGPRRNHHYQSLLPLIQATIRHNEHVNVQHPTNDLFADKLGLNLRVHFWEVVIVVNSV